MPGLRVAVLGAGKMAELTARHLTRIGVESLLITNRTFDRAVDLAEAGCIRSASPACLFRNL